MGHACSSLGKREAQAPSFVSLLASEADIEEVHRALEAEPHKVYKHLSGRLGTPLHVAAAHGRTQCVKLLLQQALRLAVRQRAEEDATIVNNSNDSSDVVLSMVNSGNNRRQTPLMLAAAAGHEECAQVLLERVRGLQQVHGGGLGLHCLCKVLASALFDQGPVARHLTSRLCHPHHQEGTRAQGTPTSSWNSHSPHQHGI